MTAHDELDALAASLPAGAVLAHVVTGPTQFITRPGASRWPRRCWAKIGDDRWRPVRSIRYYRGSAAGWLSIEWLGGWGPDLRVVTPSVTWEQAYGLRGRHEVMGVVG